MVYCKFFYVTILDEKNVFIFLGNELFTINKETGDVIFSGPMIDREVQDTYNLKIIATDRGNLSSEAALIIRVIDLNDNVPIFKQINVYPKDKLRVAVSAKSSISVNLGEYSVPHRLDNTTMSIVVWLPETLQPGTPILAANAEDIDSVGSTITYRLAKSGMEFAIHPISGQLSLVGQLRIGEQELNITAEDEGGQMTWILISVIVEEDILFEKK